MVRYEPDLNKEVVTDRIIDEMSHSLDHGQCKSNNSHRNSTQKWTHIERNLEVVAAHADLVDSPPSMAHHQPGLRLLARTVARIILFLSKFVLIPQKCFNRAVFEILMTLTNSAKETSGRIDLLNHGIEKIQGAIDQIDGLKRSVEEIEVLTTQIDGIDRSLNKLNKQLPTDLAPNLDQIRLDLNTLLDKSRVFDRENEVYIQGRSLWEYAYLDYENQHRGTREEIKSRLMVYLPLLRSANLGSSQMPILDLGCGRGEWLEILGEAGLESTGVEKNSQLFEFSRNLGGKVVQADAIEYLNSRTPNSYGAITAFHVIEHINPDLLLLFSRQVFKALKPGGLVIFETPNPERTEVGSFKFYLDPTHYKPIPSSLLHFILEYSGFERLSLMGLNPPHKPDQGKDSSQRENSQEHFSNYPDYAITGWKPK